jgi:hypothetical protein
LGVDGIPGGGDLRLLVAVGTSILMALNDRLEKAEGGVAKADGFRINGDIYLKPGRLRRWVPNHRDRACGRGAKRLAFWAPQECNSRAINHSWGCFGALNRRCK